MVEICLLNRRYYEEIYNMFFTKMFVTLGTHMALWGDQLSSHAARVLVITD